MNEVQKNWGTKNYGQKIITTKNRGKTGIAKEKFRTMGREGGGFLIYCSLNYIFHFPKLENESETAYFSQ